MVSVLAFYSDDLSSNPDEAYRFSVKFLFEKNKKNKIRKIRKELDLNCGSLLLKVNTLLSDQCDQKNRRMSIKVAQK